MIGLFLATLELIWQKKIIIQQTETLGKWLVLRTDAADQFAEEQQAGTATESPPPAINHYACEICGRSPLRNDSRLPLIM